ncbi:hypothetical protein U3516DRAFT_612971 [Neocallimastix sp. 'constans']|jgi:hypothetical protein
MKNQTHFKQVVTRLVIKLSPCFTYEPRKGVEEYLKKLLMRYVPEFDGIVIGYSNIQFLQKNAEILFDSPYFSVKVGVIFNLFSPKKNLEIVGKVNKVSADHIGLLLYGVVNASIPSDKIRKKNFKWDENSFAWKETFGDRRKICNGCVLRFTIVDILKANDMLTAIGSLLEKPKETGIIKEGEDEPKSMEMDIDENKTTVAPAKNNKIVWDDNDDEDDEAGEEEEEEDESNNNDSDASTEESDDNDNDD